MLAVLNAESLAVSEYSPDWSDVIVVDGVVYGMTDAAVVKLAGAIEATASPHVTTGKMAFASGQTCNVPRAYPKVQSSGDLELVSVADVRGVERTATMSVPGRTGDYEQERTVNLPRGTEAPTWKFTLRSKTGEAEPWSLSEFVIRTDRDQKVR